MNQALKKYLEGKSSPEEALEIIKWYQSEDAEFEFSQAVEEIWNEHLNESNLSSFPKDEVYKKILIRINDLNQNQMLTAKTPRVRNSFRMYFKIAAAIALVVFIGLALIKASVFDKKTEVVVKVSEPVIKSASKGQKTTIFLSDGSRVRLNSGSEITFLTQFAATERMVELKGEAFFEVAPDPARPFIVVSKDIETVAVGTSFNVKAYPEDKEIMVSLATGQVKIKQKDDSSYRQSFEMFLDPGYQAIYNTSKNTIRKTEFDERLHLAWKDNILYFEDAEWEEIVERLEMWYGVRVFVENEIYEDKLYSGEFQDASLRHVLESLSFTKNFKYQIRENEVMIRFYQQN